MDDAEARPAALDQRDVDGELALVLDELLGAVERIDQPERAAVDRRDLPGRDFLLGDDGITVGDLAAKRLQDQLSLPAGRLPSPVKASPFFSTSNSVS